MNNLRMGVYPFIKKNDILKIEEKDIEIIKEILKKSNHDMNWELVEMMANSMRKKMRISESGINYLNFLETLIIDFNYYQGE